MRRCTVLIAGIALAASAAGVTHAQESGGPAVTLYRTFVEPEFTVVQGLVRIDPVQLAAPTCEYGVNVVVRDASGAALVDNTWENTCPAANGAPVPGLETFQFALRPAQYRLEVAVFPKARPADRQTTTLEVTAFPVPPAASDLILGTAVGYADSTSTQSWPIRRGGIGVRAASELVIDPAQPNLSYYIELYPRDSSWTGSAVGVVRRADGKELTSFSLQDLQSQRDPLPLAGTLSVAGLPGGAYRFDVRVQLADTTLVRSHPFRVLEPLVAGASYFESLSEEELAELFDGVVVWLTAAETETYRSLSATGKRHFLVQQFGNQGPTPDDGVESALDAYLQRMKHVNAQYGERAGRSAQPGWQTDRGRIYMLHGEPSTRSARPSPVRGAAYEIWYYTAQNRYAYLFADETRMGNYRLIYTNDPQQQGVSDWERRVGIEAIDDMRQMGITLPRVDVDRDDVP